jgi:hypothetical protein
VTFAGRERVGDLVQDRVANLVDRVQERQRPRQRDRPAADPTGSEATAGVIELESPTGKPMLLHQVAR